MFTSSSSSTNTTGDVANNNSRTDRGGKNSSKDVELYLQIVFLVILLIIIIIGNVLVMIAYKINRRLRTATYTLLVSLAFCDFLVGSISLPMWMYVNLNEWFVDRTFDLFFEVIDYLTAISSALHLTIICIERWVAISKPFLQQTLTSRQYYITLAVVWLVALLISTSRFRVSMSHSKFYVLALVSLGFIIPMVVISLVNIYIFKVAKKLIQEEPTVDGGSSNERKKKVQKERRIAKTLVIVTFLFFLALLPTYTIALIGGFCLKSGCLLYKLKWHDILRLMKIAKWMQYSNSGVNPFIYAFRDAEMRRTFQMISSRAMSFRPVSAIVNFASQSDMNLGNRVGGATTQA